MQHGSIEFSWLSIFFFLSLFVAWMGFMFVQLYGTYLAFKKKWYMGVVALLVPGFSLVVGAAKLLFKKDILQ